MCALEQARVARYTGPLSSIFWNLNLQWAIVGLGLWKFALPFVEEVHQECSFGSGAGVRGGFVIQHRYGAFGVGEQIVVLE
jgi:hypothetical protein